MIPFSDDLDCASFSCGEDALDRYIRGDGAERARTARGDAETNASVIYAMVDVNVPDKLVGFYTLSATSVPRSEFSNAIRRMNGLPAYPAMPATLIGRFAVDGPHQGRGCGKVLLWSAMQKAYEASRSVASSLVIIDAKTEAARAFYEHYGFQRFKDSELRLYMPMRTVGEVLVPAPQTSND